MSTLRDDLDALQARLKEETGLQFDIGLTAYDLRQDVSADQALMAAEIMTEIVGGTQERFQSDKSAWIIANSTNGTLKAIVFCDELLDQEEGAANE